ncbi:hypothetical protein [Aureibacter tunicatorum]|uniref:Uncharacterized protein n=1 Tax=Aureibacter tunicatorum TaxID=866807 RepID=A0AAE4BS74_9BACT|nr:hypothetical protein [Aureibacter tunicatorum]MDR6238573.1 hypothetical protein [Aureibacter tunicatorum]BDD05496.1 hypothetical protein AUTU_29790 [Aureibacter tunicatorum]
MSVSREINIRLLSNKIFSDLIDGLVGQRWIFGVNNEITTLKSDDTDDFDFVGFRNFIDAKQIWDKRERNGVFNNLALWDSKSKETLNIICTVLSEKHPEYNYHYDLSIMIGIGQRIVGANRSTDFRFYLNELLPKLISLDCYICEVKCHDFDC